jgi:hypothetical protein
MLRRIDWERWSRSFGGLEAAGKIKNALDKKKDQAGL